MASPKGYTTQTAVENYLLQTIDSSFAAQIQNWIAGVEKIIDQFTGRNFKADSVASARVYDGDNTNKLLVDDCVAVTKVEVGNDPYGASFSEVPSTGADRFFLYPLNYEAKGVPISEVFLSARCFPEGMQNNRVTGKWGYSIAPPDDIVFAATVFLAGILNQQRQGGNEVKSESIGNYSVTYNSDNGNDSWADFERAKEILESYRKLII